MESEMEKPYLFLIVRPYIFADLEFVPRYSESLNKKGRKFLA